MLSTERLRSWTQGAKTSPSMRLASAMPKSASGCDGMGGRFLVCCRMFQVIVPALARQSHPVRAGPVGLKMPDFARYDARLGSGWTMLRRCVLVFCLAALG